MTTALSSLREASNLCLGFRGFGGVWTGKAEAWGRSCVGLQSRAWVGRSGM